MLHVCAEHIDEKADHQAAAVLGIALVTLGEDVGSEMALRTYDHLLHYGGLPIRRAVPLGLALMNIRLTHDADGEVAQAWQCLHRPIFQHVNACCHELPAHLMSIVLTECSQPRHYYCCIQLWRVTAIIGLGLVAAGTNNSRVAQLLRQLSEFYSREPGPLFTVRIAQGLNHMGKGLMTLHPFHSDRLVLSPVALGGVLTMLIACLDMKNTILDKYSSRCWLRYNCQRSKYYRSASHSR
eukprot:2271-Heterococcus_DN1.PRE.2